jgi:hypothetical protein
MKKMWLRALAMAAAAAVTPLQVFDSALDRMHNAKWLFPIQGPHRQVFVCGVEVKATLHDVGDVNK